MVLVAPVSGGMHIILANETGFHTEKYEGYQQILNLLYLRVLITAALGRGSKYLI